MTHSNRKKSRCPDRPTLPELDQTTKRSVPDSLASLQLRRSYQHAMNKFIDWYCSELRLALNRGVVLQYECNWKRSSLCPPGSTCGSLMSAGEHTKLPISGCSWLQASAG
jgi:hypothetical protein